MNVQHPLPVHAELWQVNALLAHNWRFFLFEGKRWWRVNAELFCPKNISPADSEAKWRRDLFLSRPAVKRLSWKYLGSLQSKEHGGFNFFSSLLRLPMLTHKHSSFPSTELSASTFRFPPTHWLRNRIHGSHGHSGPSEGRNQYMRTVKLMRWECGPTPAWCSDKQHTLIISSSQTDFHNRQAQHHALRTWPSLLYFSSLPFSHDWMNFMMIYLSCFLARLFSESYSKFPIVMAMINRFPFM